MFPSLYLFMFHPLCLNSFSAAPTIALRSMWFHSTGFLASLRRCTGVFTLEELVAWGGAGMWIGCCLVFCHFYGSDADNSACWIVYDTIANSIDNFRFASRKLTLYPLGIFVGLAACRSTSRAHDVVELCRWCRTSSWSSVLDADTTRWPALHAGAC